MMRTPLDWEPYRREHCGELGDRGNGLFRWPKFQRTVMVSNGEGWEHASISFTTRTPTWDEMEAIKRELWQEGDTVMQLHVPPAEHRNCHPYCLHLWRPTDREIPRPPSVFVAP
jgi:hypothetical protein